MSAVLDNPDVGGHLQLRPGDRPLGAGDWELVERLFADHVSECWLARKGTDLGAPRAMLRFVSDRTAIEQVRAHKPRLDMLANVATHPGLAPLKRVHLATEVACFEYEHTALPSFSAIAKELRASLGAAWPQRVIELVGQICEPLGFLHRFLPPVVHRLLSVERLVMNNGTPTMLDWASGGVSLNSSSPSPLVSPEQLRGLPPDPRDDVYALGVLWFQLLVGDFSAGRPGGSQWRRKLGETGVPAPMLELMEACFEDDPADRPRDAKALKQRLKEVSKAPVMEAVVVTITPAPQQPVPAPGVSIDPRPAAPPHSAPTPLQPAPAEAPTAAEPPRARARRSGEAVRNLLDRLQQAEPELSKLITNCIGMKLLLVPAGSFQMGSPVDEPGRRENEGPQHEVALARPFYLGVHPVTQREYSQIMAVNPAHFQEAAGGGLDHPVERVAWHEAVEFCRRLGQREEERATGRSYRLPTEAEWEYACRSGSAAAFAFGPALSARQVNFDGRFPYGDAPPAPPLERTSRVASYPANHFGLHDMHGNVWEWCRDWFAADGYANGMHKDPVGPESGQLRVIRGGSWQNQAVTCRSAYRNALAPHLRDRYTGFRVVMELTRPKEALPQ